MRNFSEESCTQSIETLEKPALDSCYDACHKYFGEAAIIIHNKNLCNLDYNLIYNRRNRFNTYPWARLNIFFLLVHVATIKVASCRSSKNINQHKS